jgi:hypothetical protein
MVSYSKPELHHLVHMVAIWNANSMGCGLFRNFDFVGKGSIGMKCCDPE